MTEPNLNVPAAQCLIGGQWRAAASGETIPVLSPSDGKPFAEISSGGAEDIEAAVKAARSAFEGGAWSKLTAAERGRLLMKVAEKIADDAESLALLEAKDTGKPIKQARADMVAAARYFEFYGGAADKVHGDTIPFMAGYQVQTIHEPYGVVGHIIPWNYPAQMTGRTLAPALAMGNATILKPAEEACLTPLRIAALAMEAGIPEGAINVVTGLGEKAGAALAGHPDINYLSFTGSPEIGALVQATTAKNHVGCTLELGGKSPQIVFEDADLDAALPFLTGAIVQNGGQTCSAGSRALIHHSIFDKLTGMLADRFSQLIAAPSMEDGDLGALISAGQKARVERFIQQAESNSVPMLARGKVSPNAPDGGYYAPPALYGPVNETDTLAREEVFGPVLCCIPFKDEADAVRIANSTDYGLVASIWSRDGGRQMRMAKALHCGQVFLNCFGAGGGIELPFGGMRKSGHGREKGFAALHEFSQIKTIILNHG